MVKITYLHPRATRGMLGLIPGWLDANDPAKASDQLDRAYSHGGGWRSFGQGQWNLNPISYALTYHGDSVMKPIARMDLRDEVILMYPHAWVLILQPDGSFEVCRMD